MINIDEFSSERKDRHETRDKLGGRLAVYISNSLNYKRRKDLESNHLESVWCQLDFKNTKSILICYVYRPPDMLQSWIDDFERENNTAQESDFKRNNYLRRYKH